MAEDDKKIEDPIDMEALSDEDFMKLDVPPAEVVDPDVEENGDAANNNADDNQAAADAAAATAGSGDASEGSDTGTGEGGSESEGSDGAGGSEEGEGTGGAGETSLTDEEKAAAATEAEKTKGANADKETLKLKDDGRTGLEKKEEGEETEEEKAAAKVVADQAEHKNFFDEVSKPFKADGKDVQVRTPQEAIRLMQMGVNYSRRMQEMKPLREMDATLTAHGLNDPAKLNELIDLSKGSKEAVQKFLAKHNIDPLDLDTSKADEHKTPNYRSDPKDVAFQEAIDDTLQANGGKELLGDINRDWDDESKEALRENSSIFGKLLEQKDTGVYSQIQKELLHQRTMGYLAGVPFLQAYEQVGNAMQKAGVFDEKKTKKTGLAPIDSGSRKEPAKKADPNPNLSSANKTAKVAPNDAAKDEPDYLSMSDDDFMKMAQPT